MAQTGIPFGHVGMSRDFLKVSGFVGKPDQEHPKRPVDGFNCKRNEVSGERLWSFFRDICKTPENFAKNCLVHNHCPLVSIWNILLFSQLY
jgi:single-strand selective monofunctional uracil DNA glycosylase